MRRENEEAAHGRISLPDAVCASCSMRAAMPSVAMLPGFLTRYECMELYARLSGRDVSNMRFYLTFAYFSLAVIIQQIYARWKRSRTQDPRFAPFDAHAPAAGLRRAPYPPRRAVSGPRRSVRAHLERRPLTLRAGTLQFLNLIATVVTQRVPRCDGYRDLEPVVPRRTCGVSGECA